MAVRNDFTAGEVLAAADLNDTFGAKLNLAGGKVLQVVRATDTTQRTTTSTTPTDVTGMSVTITPQKSTSAVIVVAIFNALAQGGNNANTNSTYYLTDSSNNPLSGADGMTFGLVNVTSSASSLLFSGLNIWGYSTPATTSATTYKLRFKANVSPAVAEVRNDLNTGQLFAIEVSA
jgi:hypothetical protein